jgi:hypothetical protein
MGTLQKTRFELLADRMVEHVAPLLLDRVGALVAARFGELPPLLDAAAAGRFIGTDEATLRRWAREGRVPHLRLGDGPKAPIRFQPQALLDHFSVPADVTECDGFASSGNGALGPAAQHGMVKPTPDEAGEETI